MTSSNPTLSPKTLGASLLLAWVGYATVLFPGRRVVTWFELCTDGISPDWLASDAMDVVGSHWKEALNRGFLDDLTGAVVSHLSKWGGGDILELAAGAGAAPTVWHDIFQEKGLCTRTILTDIQPNTKSWELQRSSGDHATGSSSDDEHEEFSFDCGTFSYIASSVDATQAQASVSSVIPNWGADGKEVRMIHLALHHFDPNLVHEILQDAARSNAAIVIADHSPTAGGVLYNGALAMKQLIKLTPGILKRNPIKILLAPAVPFIIAGLWHDATVSILRSYSQGELRQMILSTDEGKNYDVQMFRSPSYGEWIGLPSFLRLPGMEDHVMNFVFAAPPRDAPFKEQHVSSPSAYKNNATSKMYGSPEISESPPVSAGMQLLMLILVGAFSYKFLLVDRHGSRKKEVVSDSELIGKPAILAIGTANPPHEWTTDHVNIGLDWKKHNIKLGDDFVPFMKKVHTTSGVARRYFGIPPPDPEKLAQGERPQGIYGQDGNPSVSDRHAYWAEWAPKMSIQAATRALEAWGGNKNTITHVVFHSCTGFKAPGVELDVIDALKLTGVTRRLGINYMGCFGGFTGMAVAKAFCEADPTSTVLVVCAECCYSHICFDNNRSKTIGNCFFADGASAVIIGAGRPGDWAISDQQTKTLGTDTRSLMTWEPSDSCYDMYLDKGIGMSFGMHLYWNLKSYLRGVCKESVNDIEWCVHPGGRGILDFFCSDKLGLGINKTTLERSYKVLREYGNMSSGTIFFVLKEMMQDARERPTEVKPTAVCFGFGPGLTLEIAELRRIGAEEQPATCQ